MKKNITAFFILAGSFWLHAQVGVNSQTPKATFDVVAKQTNGSTSEGIIAPRLTGDQVAAADIHYGSEQEGAIVFVTAPVTSVTAKTANLTLPGYYYFDGNLWQAIGASNAILKTPFVLSGTTTDAGEDKTEAIGRTGSIGIGTDTPLEGAIVDVTATDKGILIPRVATTASITEPFNGMMIYDISSNCFKFYEDNAWTDCISKGNEQMADIDAVSATNGFAGCIYQSTLLNTSNNKFVVTVINNTFTNITGLSFSTADLVLTGANAGLTVASVSPASVSVNAQSSTPVTFTLSGTPTSSGTLTGTVTKVGLTSANSTTILSPLTFVINTAPDNIPVGCTYTLTTNATSDVTWTSSNTARATINATTGQITTLTSGAVTFTATLCNGAKVATKTITVISATGLSQTISANINLTIPAGITSFDAEATGSGGGAAGSNFISNYYYQNGYGGSGGAYVKKTYNVAVGITAITGRAGFRGGWGNANANGSDGENSTITYNGVTITAGGGKGGCYNCGIETVGGIASGGDVNLNGNPSVGRIGGGAAGPYGGGNQSANSAQGTEVGGGGSSTNFNPSTNYGGFVGTNGGNGRDGRVDIKWNCPL